MIAHVCTQASGVQEKQTESCAASCYSMEQDSWADRTFACEAVFGLLLTSCRCNLGPCVLRPPWRHPTCVCHHPYHRHSQ
jgi:hypothetical protein